MNDKMTLEELHEALEILIKSGSVFALLDTNGELRYAHKIHLTPGEQAGALTLEALQKIHAQEQAHDQN